MASPNKENCRICGFNFYSFLNYYPWGVDEKTPSFSKCPCCWVEFGNEDNSEEELIDFRKKWIKNGMIWNDQAAINGVKIGKMWNYQKAQFVNVSEEIINNLREDKFIPVDENYNPLMQLKNIGIDFTSPKTQAEYRKDILSLDEILKPWFEKLKTT